MTSDKAYSAELRFNTLFWQRTYLASDSAPVNSASMTTILSFASVLVRRYRVHAILWITMSVSAGAAATQVASSGAASLVAIDYENGIHTGGGTTNRGILSALAAANNSQTFSNQEQVIKLDGSVVFSSAGDFAIQMAATGGAADPFTVKAGSFLEIHPS